MAGVHTDPFYEGIVGGGVVSFPLINAGIPSIGPIGPCYSGPIATAHTTAGTLPTSGGPTLATVVPTIPPFIPRGIGPSTSIPTIPTMGCQPHPSPVMHGNYILVATDTIAGPFRANLSSILPFMVILNLPDLAHLTKYPIRHHPQWPPMPTNIPSNIPKFE